MLHRDRPERRQRLGLMEHPLGEIGVDAGRAPTRRRRAARACPRSRSRPRAGRGRGRSRRGAASARARAGLCTTAARAANSATACAWPSMYGDLRSTKFAIASSAASNSLARQRDGKRRLGVDHGVPRAQRVEVRRGSRPRRQPGDRRVPGRTGRRAAPVRAPALPRRRRPGARPRRTRRAARDAPRAGSRRPRDSRAIPFRPTARTPRRARRARLVGQLELLAERSGHRGVVIDHVVDLAMARERELEPDAEAVQRRVAGSDPPHPGTWPCACSAARSRTSRISARCRRRTISPARERPYGSRR